MGLHAEHDEIRLQMCQYIRDFPVGDRRGWDLLDEHCRGWIEMAEAYARGEIGEEDMRAAFNAAYGAYKQIPAYTTNHIVLPALIMEPDSWGFDVSHLKQRFTDMKVNMHPRDFEAPHEAGNG